MITEDEDKTKKIDIMSRKISAPLTALPEGLIKNCIVEIDDNGVILSIEREVSDLDSRAGVERYDGMLMPGMISCHCHLEYSYVKGMIPRGGGLPKFIETIIDIKFNRPIEDSKKIEASAKWDKFMYDNGINAVGDHSNYEFTTPIKSASPIYYHSFLEMLEEDDKSASESFKVGNERVEIQKAAGVVATVSPHATYTLNDEFLNMIGSSDNKGVLSVHFKESVVLGGENERDRIFNAISADRSGLLLIHSIYADNDDIKAAVDKYGDKVTVVPCPLSNIYIEQRLPDFDMFVKNGIRIALGTDSLSSNETLSILEEMKCIEQHYPNYPLTTIIKWATINGADALEISDWAGSIEEGKRPGLVLIEGVDLKAERLTADASPRRLA